MTSAFFIGRGLVMAMQTPCCVSRRERTFAIAIGLGGLQASDPEIGVVIKWLMNASAPSEAEVALTGRAVKMLWRNKELLVMQAGVLYYKWFPSYLVGRVDGVW
eukprot:GHVO01043537.1.p1 GENE.GHVO01043537.1~~GHVO01043537.1.p1  ORF type:complete len:104 (-),score=10.50 GHVO01043537.1:128-439(-)